MDAFPALIIVKGDFSTVLEMTTSQQLSSFPTVAENSPSMKTPVKCRCKDLLEMDLRVILPSVPAKHYT